MRPLWHDVAKATPYKSSCPTWSISEFPHTGCSINPKECKYKLRYLEYRTVSLMRCCSTLTDTDHIVIMWILTFSVLHLNFVFELRVWNFLCDGPLNHCACCLHTGSWIETFIIFSLFYLCFCFGPNVCPANFSFKICRGVPWHGSVRNIILIHTYTIRGASRWMRELNGAKSTIGL
jgi:hypothetical protein